MRCLARNKQTVSYKVYQSIADAVDSNGDYTGEKTITYGSLQTAELMVSPPQGEAYAEAFGKNIDYDRVMVGEDPSVAIDENSILWIDAVTTGNHDYICKARQPWKNSIVWAIKKIV